MQNKKILIVEDENKIVEVIKSYLLAEGFEPYVLYNGKGALEMFKKINPSLVILDLMLPDISGEDICKSLRKSSSVPILMLTAKVEEGDILNGLSIGADDYMTKPFSPKQLVARVHVLLRRIENSIVPFSNIQSYNNDDLVIDSNKHIIMKKHKEIDLTPSEFNILSVLTKYPTKVFTRDELINIALGDDYEGYDRIIDTHIKNLRKKIEDNEKIPNYILTVYGVGYRFGGETSES